MLEHPRKGQTCTWLDDDGHLQQGQVWDWDPAIPDLVVVRDIRSRQDPTILNREAIQPGWATRDTARAHIDAARRKLKGPDALN